MLGKSADRLYALRLQEWFKYKPGWVWHRCRWCWGIDVKRGGRGDFTIEASFSCEFPYVFSGSDLMQHIRNYSSFTLSRRKICRYSRLPTVRIPVYLACWTRYGIHALKSYISDIAIWRSESGTSMETMATIGGSILLAGLSTMAFILNSLSSRVSYSLFVPLQYCSPPFQHVGLKPSQFSEHIS